jgi:atypical dual specificity phosphatase
VSGRPLDRWYGLGSGPIRQNRPGLARVLPRLLVGEYPNVADAAWLRDTYGVTAVVNLQDDYDLASKRLRARDLEQAWREAGVALHRVPVPDGEPDVLAGHLPGLVALLAQLLDGGACVYLHCNAGFNRAPTAAIAYLHQRHGFTLRVATAFVKRRRPCVPYVRALELYLAARG